MHKTEKNKDFTKKNEGHFKAYLQLAGLFAKNYFKSFPGPFFTFGLPLFFLILFYFTLGVNGSTYNILHGHDIIGGYILLASVSAGLNFLSQRISEWKSSVFLKRLNVTPLKKWEFMFVIIGFYSFICILGTMWMFLWSIIVNPTYQIENFQKYTNWWYMILGIILNIFIAVSLAIFIAGIATSPSMGEGITMLIFFPSIFLTGIALPISIFGPSADIINKIGYVIPFKYSVTIFLYGWGYNMHIPSQPGLPSYDLQSLGFTEIWQPILGGILYPILLLGISLKTFKWESK